MNQGIFNDLEQLKGNAPGWLKKFPKGLRARLVQLYWLRNDLRDFIAEVIGRAPSHSLRLALYRGLLGMKIGEKTSLHRGWRVVAPANVIIADHSVINRDVVLDGRSGLKIGRNVSVSEDVMILTLEHDPNSPDFAPRGAPVIIQDYVFIGARAIILPGVIVGKGAVVAAGAVVTKDVSEFQIVAGVPARPIGQRNSELHYSLDYRKFLG